MNEPTADDLTRDLMADLAWITSDEVCLTARTVAVAAAGLRRAIAAEQRARDGDEAHSMAMEWHAKQDDRIKELEASLAETQQWLRESDAAADRAEARAKELEATLNAPRADDVRALVIEMRRYVLAHGVLLGECVAWDRLKKLAGVGQDENCPSEE